MELKEFGENFKRAVGTITKKSGEVSESTKLSLEINGIENDIEKLYIKIGEIVYDAYKNENDFSHDVISYCDQIAENYAKIEKVQNEINAIKKLKTCPNCHKAIDEQVSYCPYCGASMMGSEE